MKKILGIAIIGIAALALMSVAAPDAKANCATGKQFGQVLTFGTDGVYHYVRFGADSAANNASVVGRFWQPGARSTQNEGSYDDNQWLAFFPGNIASIAGDLGSAGVVGCPVTEMIVLFQTPAGSGARAQVGVGRVNEQPGDAEAYAYNRLLADIEMRDIPFAKIASKSNSAGIWTLNLQFDDVAGLFHGVNAAGAALSPYGTITGYRLMRKNATNNADDGRDATAWTFTGSRVATAAGGGTLQGFQVDCNQVTGQDVLLGVQLEFDNGQFLGDQVSQASVVKCSGQIAEPGQPNFKIIDRKTTSPRPAQK